jgi:hypothetical protein
LVISTSPTTSIVSFSFTNEIVPKILMTCPFDNLHTDGRLSSQKSSVGDFELARRLCVYSFNAAPTVTVTNDSSDIKLKILENVWEEFHSNENPICMQVIKGHIIS